MTYSYWKSLAEFVLSNNDKIIYHWSKFSDFLKNRLHYQAKVWKNFFLSYLVNAPYKIEFFSSAYEDLIWVVTFSIYLFDMIGVDINAEQSKYLKFISNR